MVRGGKVNKCYFSPAINIRTQGNPFLNNPETEELPVDCSFVYRLE